MGTRLCASSESGLRPTTTSWPAIRAARQHLLLRHPQRDGHEWADTALATDYMERSFAGFPRSYPDGMED